MMAIAIESKQSDNSKETLKVKLDLSFREGEEEEGLHLLGDQISTQST